MSIKAWPKALFMAAVMFIKGSSDLKLDYVFDQISFRELRN